MVTTSIDFARLEKSIKTAQVNFPSTDRDTARKLFGLVFKNQIKYKNIMNVAEKAINHYSIPDQYRAGYRYVVANYFSIEVDRTGKPVPKKRTV